MKKKNVKNTSNIAKFSSNKITKLDAKKIKGGGDGDIVVEDVILM